MSRSGERRKPRAEMRVKALADENAALRADRSSLETRVKELRAELDAAARLHREVRTRLEETKARTEGESARLQQALNERDRAALKLTGQLIDANERNTRLVGWSVKASKLLSEALSIADRDGASHAVLCSARERTRRDDTCWRTEARDVLAESPASDKPNRQPSPEGSIDGGYDAGPARDDR